MCVPPEIHVEILTSKVIGRWGIWEMLRALMKGIKFPYKRNPREPLTLRPCEDTGRRWWSMNQDGGVSPDTESACTLIVAFAAFRRTTRNKCFFVQDPQSGILLQQPDRHGRCSVFSNLSLPFSLSLALLPSFILFLPSLPSFFPSFRTLFYRYLSTV